MKVMIKILKVLVCFVCWLTISPLFYYLSGRWKLMRRRLFLMLVSPLFLYLYLNILIYGFQAYIDYQRKYYFANEERIERITGIQFPDMDIVEYHKGSSSFTGDYSDALEMELEDSLSETFYHSLDSLIETGHTGWEKKGNTYVFSKTWGNGLPAPEGESDEEDRSFSVTLEKGSKRVFINSRMW